MHSYGFSDFDSISKKLNYDSGRGYPLSWKELFSLCDYYRDANHISPNDFVILLTERKNTLNWFSMFELQRNAFVHCADWEIFTNAAPQYPIAYEVMANVMRCLMNPKMELSVPYFHETAIGCMNDLCMDKKSIMLKLKTGDICAVCHTKLIDEQVDERIIEQAFDIFEGIRKQFLFRQGLQRSVRPGKIELNEQRKLFFNDLGNLELKLYPLDKVLYVFYLNHLEGVRLNELNDHQQEMLSLYRKFSNAGCDDAIKLKIKDLIDPFSGSFSQKKSRINRKINDLLGPNLAKYYSIAGEPGERFKINLPADLISLRILATTRL